MLKKLLLFFSIISLAIPAPVLATTTGEQAKIGLWQATKNKIKAVCTKRNLIAAGGVLVAIGGAYLLLKKDQAHPAFLAHPAAPIPKPKVEPVRPAQKGGECPICADEDKELELFSMSEKCDHHICRNCAIRNIDTALERREATTLRCALCHQKQEEQLLEDIEYAKRFVHDDIDRLARLGELEASIWASTPNAPQRLCPHCGSTLFNLDENGRSYTCQKCENRFCTRCRLGHTRDNPCNDDKASKQWIEEHTVACPRCNERIEKSYGCDHMMCGKHAHGGYRGGVGCGYEFCWRCLGAYNHGNGHGFCPINNPKYRHNMW